MERFKLIYEVPILYTMFVLCFLVELVEVLPSIVTAYISMFWHEEKHGIELPR